MKIIYFVRHCHYDNSHHILPGRLPVELSPDGLKQAEKLHEYFLDKGIEKIYSSPVLRCKQTTNIISGKKIPITYDQRLLESFSAYQGYWIENWDHFFSHKDELSGENFQDIQNRILSFFNELVTKPEKKVIVCSHGDPLFTFYLYLTKKPLIHELDRIGDAGDPLYQGKGTVRELLVHDDETYEFKDIVRL